MKTFQGKVQRPPRGLEPPMGAALLGVAPRHLPGRGRKVGPLAIRARARLGCASGIDWRRQEQREGEQARGHWFMGSRRATSMW